MISLPEEKVLYTEIQKKLFYIIPEKWESIFLYASVIDVPNSKKPVGEMYFYYLPKSIIKKKFVIFINKAKNFFTTGKSVLYCQHGKENNKS